MAWDTTEGSVVSAAGATFEVNGNITAVEAGVNLKELVLSFARDAGYGKFRFYVNGTEVLPQNAPEVTEAGVAYKIAPYDVAG